MDSFLRLRADHYLIYIAYREHGNDGIAKMLFEIRTMRHEHGYIDKLLQRAVKDLIEILHDPEYGASLETYIYFITAIQVITFLTNYADLTAVDEQGNRAVDYVLNMIIGSELTYESGRRIVSPGLLDLENDPVLMTKLLCALMNRELLNTPYKWGYSYFSVFVLLGWWKMVEWGLDVGADVSDNGVCPNIPMDAVFVERYLAVPGERIPCDLFARLIHPTNVNRPIAPGSDPKVEDFEKLACPLHLLAEYCYDEDFFICLLKAGARIDIVNCLDDLPMDIYAECLQEDNDPFLFSRLVPKSVGISPTLLIKLLNSWWERSQQRSIVDFITSMFCQHLMLSSGWQEVGLREPKCSPGSFQLLIDEYSQPAMCGSGIESVIDILTECGIRATHTRPLNLLSSNHSSIHNNPTNANRRRHIVDKVQKKWNEFRILVPRLLLQCVRVTRSALKVVTEERLQTLPVPKLTQDFISLRPMMEVVYEEFLNRIAFEI